MRFLRVSAIHYPHAKSLPYLLNPRLMDAPYAEQLASFFSFHFHYSDSISHYLRQRNYLASEILYDVEPLQKKWADENGVAYSPKNWQSEILLHQIQKMKPEILYLHNLAALPHSVLERKKELFPFLRLLILFRGYPEANRDLLRLLSHANLLLVGSPALQKTCLEYRLHPHLFYHYFDHRILDKLDRSSPSRPFTFVGTSGFHYGWNHQPRYQFLIELLKSTDLECWLDESPGVIITPWKESIKRFIERALSVLPKEQLRQIAENQNLSSSIQKLAFNAKARKQAKAHGKILFPDQRIAEFFPGRCHGTLFGLEMYRMLATSKVTFNKHTFAASGTVDNIRLFEGTGVGTCLLTDMGSNLAQLFDLDREVVAYSSIHECREKIKYLLNNEPIRKEIALKGQERTLREHTALQRAMQLDELIQRKLNSGN